VVDGDDAVRVVRALGVDHIATLAAADVTEDIVTRIPQTEGFVEKLARPARDVEMLIGMENQGWMPARQHGSNGDHDAPPVVGAAGMRGVPRLRLQQPELSD
jgi:hypothetical protein